jgi:hypothetical protein
MIRKYIKDRLFHAGIARVEIERAANKAKIRIYTARPGIVIGKKGAEIEALRRDLESKFRREILIDIQEVRRSPTGSQSCLPASHETSGHGRPEIWRQGRPRGFRRPVGWRRNGPKRMVSRRPRPTSYTARRYRLWYGARSHHLRDYRSEGVDFQGGGSSLDTPSRMICLFSTLQGNRNAGIGINRRL